MGAVQKKEGRENDESGEEPPLVQPQAPVKKEGTVGATQHCAKHDVAEACVALGGNDTHTSGKSLAAEFFAREADVAAYLSAVGFFQAEHASVLCHTVCAATLASIPRLLGVQIPKKSGLACLDKACRVEVEASDEVLSSRQQQEVHSKLSKSD